MLIVFIHVVYYSAAGMRRRAHTTSLNSKQPSKPFKTQKPWARWRTTSCAKPTTLLPSLFGLPTCPLQQDAITSIPQVVHASTHGRWDHLCPLVQSKTNINSQSVAIAPSPRCFPSNMALRSPSADPYWIHMELQPLPLISLCSSEETIVGDP